jgi:carbohydrate-binding DOMON domain-containing protein
MSTQYRLVQSEKTASGGCSAGQGSSEPVAPRIYCTTTGCKDTTNKNKPLSSSLKDISQLLALFQQ